MSKIYIIGVQVKLITVAKKLFEEEVLASIYPQRACHFWHLTYVSWRRPWLVTYLNYCIVTFGKIKIFYQIEKLNPSVMEETAQ